jgi:uncharacterized peroxidase-related enzyme
VTWIRTVPPESATGELRAFYEHAASASTRGSVSTLWRALSLDPPALGALHAAYRALVLEPAPLTRAQAEMIAMVVSATNGCGYCVSHHGPRLARATGDEGLARAVALDYRAANLAARDRVLLDHCVALTCEPDERTPADVERVREYGFDDGAILKATAIASYYNLVNRLVLALGVPLENGLDAWEFGRQK